MLRVILAALVAVVCATSVYAAKDFRVPGMRKNDVYLTEQGLKRKIVGRTVMFTDGSLASYRRDGSYLWRRDEYDDGVTGRYAIKRNGMVCVRMDRGRNRCDTYVRSVSNYYFLTSGGGRMKIKGFLRD